MPEREALRPVGEAAGGLTAYPEDEAMLRRRLAAAVVDVGSVSRRLKRCEITLCQGMCCYDGVYVSEASARAVEEIARRHADFLAGLGLRLPGRVIVEGDWPWRRGGLKTAVQPRPFSRKVPGFPAHFRDTACVFLAPDGRCALQVLSAHLGRHPWYYKPIKCWMHPITIQGEDEARLVLPSYETDPFRFPGYDGFVSQIFCGKTCLRGEPAAAVLREELRFLSQIVGRDLVNETQVRPGG